MSREAAHPSAIPRRGARHTVRLFLFAAGVLLAVMIGLSRAYLGVHWPGDVLAGSDAGDAHPASAG